MQRHFVWIVLAACANEPIASRQPEPEREREPVPGPRPIAPVPVDVLGTSSSGSPACSAVEEVEYNHWSGDRKPEVIHHSVHGCHYATAGEVCWKVDVATARYEMLKAGAVSRNHGRHDVRIHAIAPTAVEDAQGMLVGFKPATEQRGDVRVTVSPHGQNQDGETTLCKGTRCTKHAADRALMSADWTFMIAVGDTSTFGVDIASGKERFVIPTDLSGIAGMSHAFHGDLAVVPVGSRSFALDGVYETYDTRTGKKLCTLGKPGYQTEEYYAITPTRWVLRVSPKRPAPTHPGYADEVMFQDPTTCKVLATIPSPITTEPNIPVVEGWTETRRFFPVLLPTEHDAVLAFPGGTVAVLDATTLTLAKVIRPPACKR
jgi:hypothetical protein